MYLFSDLHFSSNIPVFLEDNNAHFIFLVHDNNNETLVRKQRLSFQVAFQKKRSYLILFQ